MTTADSPTWTVWVDDRGYNSSGSDDFEDEGEELWTGALVRRHSSRSLTGASDSHRSLRRCVAFNSRSRLAGAHARGWPAESADAVLATLQPCCGGGCAICYDNCPSPPAAEALGPRATPPPPDASDPNPLAAAESPRDSHPGVATPCGHRFHSACLSRWVFTCLSQGHPPACPNCRSVLGRT
ncbi:hypothetical protein DIPPA_00203 [Diplonema papillatum]|nr:hypothetical protein DIPPA_00203 [Diplonema papillatum]